MRVSVDYDARLKKIVLTDKAVDIHKKIAKNIDATEKLLSRNIDDKELEEFFSTLDKIKANLEVG